MSYQKTIEELEELADRIDSKELWKLPGMEHSSLSPSEKNELDAGVNLRRYASLLRDKEDQAKPGRVYIRGSKLERADSSYPRKRGCGDRAWRSVVSSVSDDFDARYPDSPMHMAWLVSDELPRMILLFENQRTTKENYKLTCHLGRSCSDCKWLKPIDESTEMTDEAKDEAKAWTCATHILVKANLTNGISEFLRESYPKTNSKSGSNSDYT